MLETILGAIVTEKYNSVCPFVFQEKKNSFWPKRNFSGFWSSDSFTLKLLSWKLKQGNFKDLFIDLFKVSNDEFIAC